MVRHLTSAWYFNDNMAREVIKSLDYWRGYRPFLARCNLYLAALHSEQCFDFAKVARFETGSVVPSGLYEYRAAKFQPNFG